MNTVQEIDRLLEQASVDVARAEREFSSSEQGETEWALVQQAHVRREQLLARRRALVEKEAEAAKKKSDAERAAKLKKLDSLCKKLEGVITDNKALIDAFVNLERLAYDAHQTFEEVISQHNNLHREATGLARELGDDRRIPPMTSGPQLRQHRSVEIARAKRAEDRPGDVSECIKGSPSALSISEANARACAAAIEDSAA